MQGYFFKKYSDITIEQKPSIDHHAYYSGRNTMSLWTRIKSIPKGFVKLYHETKSVNLLKDQLVTTRKENELIRSNVESLKKIVLFFFIQLPPVIGYFPMIIALHYPKQMLTHHFWTDEQKQQFLAEDFQNRKYHARLFAKEIANYKDKGRKEPTTVEDIESHHLRLLAGAHSIFENHFALSITPAFLLRYWLNQRGHWVIKDDLKLIEEGTDKIERLDLQHIAVTRGLNPLQDDVSLKMNIKTWLADERWAVERTVYSSVQPSVSTGKKSEIVYKVLRAISECSRHNE